MVRHDELSNANNYVDYTVLFGGMVLAVFMLYLEAVFTYDEDSKVDKSTDTGEDSVVPEVDSEESSGLDLDLLD
jgi:hypothetical protein